MLSYAVYWVLQQLGQLYPLNCSFVLSGIDQFFKFDFEGSPVRNLVGWDREFYMCEQASTLDGHLITFYNSVDKGPLETLPFVVVRIDS